MPVWFKDREIILIERIKSFTARLGWLSNYMPTPIHAFVALFQMKSNPNRVFEGAYQGQRFYFSSADMSAVREVLQDAEYSFLTDYLSQIDHPTILDVGANIGTFSLWARGVAPHVNIVSVEPSDVTFSKLKQTASSIENSNWFLLNKAAWKDNSAISFNDSGESMGHKVSDKGNRTVEGVSLHDLLSNAKNRFGVDEIDLMKVDIEGAEESFLQDTADIYDALKAVKRLVIEIHPEYCNPDGVMDLLKKSYRCVEDQPGRLSKKPLLYCYN